MLRVGKVSLEYLSGIFRFLQQHSSDMLKQRENGIWIYKICPAAPNQPIRQQSSRRGDVCTAHVHARAAPEGGSFMYGFLAACEVKSS